MQYLAKTKCCYKLLGFLLRSQNARSNQQKMSRSLSLHPPVQPVAEPVVVPCTATGSGCDGITSNIKLEGLATKMAMCPVFLAIWSYPLVSWKTFTSYSSMIFPLTPSLADASDRRRRAWASVPFPKEKLTSHHIFTTSRAMKYRPTNPSPIFTGQKYSFLSKGYFTILTKPVGSITFHSKPSFFETVCKSLAWRIDWVSCSARPHSS